MYRSSVYASSTKSPRSPHPLALRRQFDFLEDFVSDTSLNQQSLQESFPGSTDTEDDNENVVDVVREHELLVRRGWTYSLRLWQINTWNVYSYHIGCHCDHDSFPYKVLSASGTRRTRSPLPHHMSPERCLLRHSRPAAME